MEKNLCALSRELREIGMASAIVVFTSNRTKMKSQPKYLSVNLMKLPHFQPQAVKPILIIITIYRAVLYFETFKVTLGDRTMLRNGSCQVNWCWVLSLEPSAGPSCSVSLCGRMSLELPRGHQAHLHSVDRAESHILSASHFAHRACDPTFEARQLHILYISLLPRLRSAGSFCPLQNRETMYQDQCLSWPHI